MMLRRRIFGEANYHLLYSDGKAWTTTEEHVDQTTEIICKYVMPEYTKTMIVFGVASTYPTGFQYVIRSNTDRRFDVGTTNHRLTFTINNDGKLHELKYDAVTGNVYYNGAIKGNVTSADLSETNYQNRYLTLYGQNSGDGSSYAVDGNTICNAGIAQFTIKKNGVIVSNLIPAINNNVPCLYDTVKNAYRYNMNNQGSFTYI